MTKLIEGKEYLFRVRAENRFGPGPPCVSKPLIAKDPFGKIPLASKLCFFTICVNICSITTCKFEFFSHPRKLIQTPYFFFLTEPPDAPDKPIVEDVTSNSMLVKWNEPKDNGSPILGYWLEKREVNSTHWTRVNRSLLNSLKTKVEGLLEGLTYVFRVCAENAAGPGKFSPPSDPKTARDPICK